MRGKAPTWGAILVCLSGFAFARPVHAATIAVPAGGDLQAALNAAQPGDVITLAPGATYTGNFTLPNKGVSELYITVRSAAPDSSLPAEGVRMTPAYAAQLPKIKSATSVSALRTKTSAHHWKLMFLEFQANLAGYGEIITLGAGDSTQTLVSQVPHHLVLDRVYIHGDPKLGQKRGVALHSSDTSIVNSYISDIKAVGQDSQAIGGSNGPGNYLIENNYLEAATENFLLGGADPPIANLVTSNVVFRRNHVSKPLAWRDAILATPANVSAAVAVGQGSLGAGTYSYKVAARAAAGQTTKAYSATADVTATIEAGATGGVTMSWTPVVNAEEYVIYGRVAGGTMMYWKTTVPYFTDNGTDGQASTPPASTKWAVKNLFELKNARDVTVEGNVFENLWVAAQAGFPIVFTPRNQSGSAPWCIVERVVFQNNLIRHTAGGVNILGTDDIFPSGTTNTITVRGNIFNDMGSQWGSGSKGFQIGDGGNAIVIDHNTIDTNVSAVVAVYGGTATSPTPVTGFSYTNNMSEHRSYGIFGANMSPGLLSINAYFPGSTIRRNVLAGGSASKYPADNFFPTVAAWKTAFVNFDNAEYGLLPSSPYIAAGTDGADVGANVAVVMAEAAIALSGNTNTTSTPSPVHITTTSLPGGMVNASYAQTLACTGGTAPCAWQVNDASLPTGLSFDAVAGVLSGVPTAVQTGMLSVTAYDPTTPDNSASASWPIVIDAPTFAIAFSTPVEGMTGTSYQFTPSITGATSAVTWTVLTGNLPAGLQLDAFSGVISGTPTGWGTTTALLQAQESAPPNRADARAVSITIAPLPLVVTTTALPAANYQQAYSASLAASGGSGTTGWTLVSGALPAGMSLNPSGVLSGAPTAVGTFGITARATDANWPSHSADATLSLVVISPTFAIMLPSPPAAQVGVAYQIAGSVVGNVGPVTWSIISGALPGGMALNASTGVVAGVPTARGSFTATIQAKDTAAPTRVVSGPLTIVVAPTAIAITTSSLAAGQVSKVYQATLAASGGTGTTTWSLASGALPSGLTLSASGSIAGTPTAAGTFSLTVKATDAGWTSNVATKALSITVAAASAPPTARDIVLYATDATNLHGTWTLVSDATAAGGKRLWNQDKGAAKVSTALTAPKNYFDITFQAQAGVAYHFWVRGKADANSFANDSVFVQFSGAVTVNGGATHRIGTTAALGISIENGTNAGLSGWGWNDDDYGGWGSNVYFGTTGLQTLRVQVREDGLSIDQIVISADRYKSVSPGAFKNDATIVPR